MTNDHRPMTLFHRRTLRHATNTFRISPLCYEKDSSFLQQGVMTRLSVQTAGLTDQGQVRTNNEDAVWVDPKLGLLIVADGMGGHQSGEVASGIAVSSIPENFSQLTKTQNVGDTNGKGFSVETDRLGNCFKIANQKIFEA